MHVQELNRKDDPKLKHYKVKSTHYKPTLTVTTHCRSGMIDYKSNVRYMMKQQLQHLKCLADEQNKYENRKLSLQWLLRVSGWGIRGRGIGIGWC